MLAPVPVNPPFHVQTSRSFHFGVKSPNPFGGTVHLKSDLELGVVLPATGANVSQPKSQLDLDLLSINTIRTLAIDAVQQANAGHPGAPMGLAPVVYELWQEFLRYDPADPIWPNRDRFVLSAGHASMLLYATLHLAGVRAVNAKGEGTKDAAVPTAEIKRFQP